jgi:Xaa-Pro aminopeptidase
MNHDTRITRLMENLESPLLVTSLTNIRYLTGFTGSNAFLYVTPERATFLTDGRYGEVARELMNRVERTTVLVYREGRYDRLVELFEGAVAVQLEAPHVSWQAQSALAQRFAGRLEASTGIIERLRSIKDAEEVAALRAAATAGDHAFAVLDEVWRQAGTEQDLAEVLITSMGQAGGERAGWPPIVAVGANSAFPHHRTGKDFLEDGVLLLDYGCVVDGYHSDMTRTVWRGSAPDAEVARVYAAVREANEAGIAAVRPGATAGSVDMAAREVLASHGLEEQFLHSTGHGVGLDIHEAPSVRRGSEEMLEPGNVVTVEPGAYLHGYFGVRLEDMVLVTEDGGDVLTHATKELIP